MLYVFKSTIGSVVLLSTHILVIAVGISTGIMYSDCLIVWEIRLFDTN